jgi:hypothetical protein
MKPKYPTIKLGLIDRYVGFQMETGPIISGYRGKIVELSPGTTHDTW